MTLRKKSDVPTHQIERDRLESLATYPIAPGQGYDRIVELAAQACGTPEAFVSVVEADRLSFLAAAGSDVSELPRAGTLCSWVVEHCAPLVVDDARQDERFRDNPRVRGNHLRAYAGVPLIGRDGLPLGVLCVIDTEARSFSADERALLLAVAQLCAHALDRARLYQVERQAGGRAMRLQAIMTMLVEAVTPEQVATVVTADGAAARCRWVEGQRRRR